MTAKIDVAVAKNAVRLFALRKNMLAVEQRNQTARSMRDAVMGRSGYAETD